MVGLLHPAGDEQLMTPNTPQRAGTEARPARWRVDWQPLAVRGVAYAAMFTQAATPVSASLSLAAAFAALYSAPMSVAWAQDPPDMTFEEAAALGEQTGRESLPGPRGDADTVYFVDEDGLETMSALELFGGNALSPDVATLEGLSDSSAISVFMNSAHARIEGENTPLGEAMRTARSSARSRSHPDMTGDPAFSQTDAILDGTDPVFSTFFSGCTEIAVPTTTGGTVHMPEYEYCSRVTLPIESCEFIHDYQVALIDFSGLGSGRKSSCGNGCIDIELGRQGDNYWDGGSCTIYEESFSLRVDNTNAIDSVTIEEASWDDHIQVQVNGTPVWTAPEATFPTGLSDCDLSASPSSSGPSLTSYFTDDDNRNVTVKMRIAVGDGGEGYMRVRIRFSPARTVVVDEWTITPECMGLVHGLNDGACTPLETLCLDGPDHGVPCITIGDVQLCQSDLAPPPIRNGYSPLCRHGSVTADCRFYLGNLQCFYDTQGDLQCFDNTGGRENGCVDQESRSECAYVGASCLTSTLGSSGQCYAWEETWDCGYAVGGVQGTTRTLECGGPIRCMGDECLTASAEVNADFVNAATQLEAMQYGAMDFECAGTDPSSCAIFSGEGLECKKALGGELEQDCCQTPVSANLGTYLALSKQMWNLGKRTQQLNALTDIGGNVAGAWETLSSGATNTLARAREPFTSAWGSLAEKWGTTTGIDGIQSLSLDQLQGQMVDRIGTFVTDTFGDTIGGFFFEEGVGSQAGQLVLQSGIQTAMAVIMWVYTIYVVVQLLAQIIWKCEEAELQLAIKREIRSCTYIGEYCATSLGFGCIEQRRAYCCYNSPLSRIINEQAIPQLGQTFGTPETPECTGLTVAEVQALDWTRIDLSEWYGLLIEEDMLPNTVGEADNRYSLSNSTTLEQDPGGTNALDRARNRADAVDLEGVRQEVRDNLWRGI